MKKGIIIVILAFLPAIIGVLYYYISLKFIEPVVYDEPMCEGEGSCRECLELRERGARLSCWMIYEGGYTYKDCIEYKKEHPDILCRL